MSGVSFVVGWIYASTPDAGRLIKGPYDPETKKAWDPALARLAAFNKNVVLTPGNAGTLDMLNRGEIAMGPVGSTCSTLGRPTARSRRPSN